MVFDSDSYVVTWTVSSCPSLPLKLKLSLKLRPCIARGDAHSVAFDSDSYVVTWTVSSYLRSLLGLKFKLKLKLPLFIFVVLLSRKRYRGVIP